MRKITALLLVCLLLCGVAAAEETSDTVAFGNVSFSRDATYIDMGEETVSSMDDFIAFLKEFPNLKKVDMFATQVTAAQVGKLTEALPEVEFGWKLQLMKYKTRHIVRTDAEAFSTLHGKCKPGIRAPEILHEPAGAGSGAQQSDGYHLPSEHAAPAGADPRRKPEAEEH